MFRIHHFFQRQGVKEKMSNKALSVSSSSEGEKGQNRRSSIFTIFTTVSRRWWISMGILLTALALGLGLGLGLGLKQNAGDTGADAIVDLGYAKYRGKVLGDGTSHWLGMRYAAAPVGQLRFAAPQDPELTHTIQAADKVSLISRQSIDRYNLYDVKVWFSMSRNAFRHRR